MRFSITRFRIKSEIMSIKYPKIYRWGAPESDGFLKDNETYEVTEKLDGANCRFWLDETGTFYCGSRNNNHIVNQETEFLNGLGTYSHTHKDALIFLLHQAGPNKVLVGEWMIPHTIDYKLNKKFVALYDVIDLQTGQSVSFTERNRILNSLPKLNEETTPIIIPIQLMNKTQLLELPSIVSTKMSFLNPLVPIEGLVIKNDNHPCHIKIIAPEFKEKNEGIWSNKEGPQDSNEEGIAKTYCTQQRFNKIIQKRFPGELAPILNMKDIPWLGGMTYADILTEEIQDIARHWKQVNFKALQTEIMKKTKLHIEAKMMGSVAIEPVVMN